VFEVVRNPKSGKPYTNAEVARMTLGDLSEEDVERIRTGALSDPTVGQVAVLAGVFGVEPFSTSWIGGNRLYSIKNSCRRSGMRTCEDITRESSRLSDGERRLVLGIVRQFRDQKAAPST